MSAQGFVRAQQDQCRVCHLAIDDQLRIRKELHCGANREVLVRRLPLPELSKNFHGRRVEVVQSGSGTNFSREIRSGLIKNASKPVLRHGNQRIAAPHPIGALILQGHADGTRGNLKDQHPAVRVLEFLGIKAKPQSLNQTGLRPFEVGKRPTANHRARLLIRHPQDHPAAAFVGEGNAVLHQLLKVELSLRLFELQTLVFSGVHPGMETLIRKLFCETLPPTSACPGQRACYPSFPHSQMDFPQLSRLHVRYGGSNFLDPRMGVWPGSGAQHNDGQPSAREVLLVLKVLVSGYQQLVAFALRTIQEFSVAQLRPSFPSGRVHRMFGQEVAEWPGRTLVKQDFQRYSPARVP